MADDRDDTKTKVSTHDRVIALYGDRLLPPLGQRLGSLAGLLVKESALALLLVDASSLLEIERLYGARAFRTALDALTQRVRTRVQREIGEEVVVTSGALEEEHLLLFIPRARSESAFLLHELPRLAEELRSYVDLCLKQIVYPYLHERPEVPIGTGFALHRPFQRPEAQIRKLIETTQSAARFERERRNRDRAVALDRILLEESVSTVFEPIVKLASREVIGYEALSRGPSNSGLETPTALFGVAEQSDREYELDSLCRRRALANARGISPEQLLFLNILPTCIQDPDFQAVRVRETLDTLGLAPRNLVLEVSERKAISNFPIFREATDHFSRLGFRIALDDTGAGFSSLEAALELSPDFLKIDMSLIRGIEESPEKQELLRGLRGVAGKMGSTLIAEGIETEHELEVIRGLGIECGQGFHLGRGTPSPTAAGSDSRTGSR
ncbi:MAG TPA: EAL domain-containing protein [Myxococcota bacterium]|nr:EAL domain-containing protein [Myxococcota bacterium]